MDVNVIYVSIPTGGRGSKQSEVNSEKHLEKKRLIDDGVSPRGGKNQAR